MIEYCNLRVVQNPIQYMYTWYRTCPVQRRLLMQCPLKTLPITVRSSCIYTYVLAVHIHQDVLYVKPHPYYCDTMSVPSPHLSVNTSPCAVLWYSPKMWSHSVTSPVSQASSRNEIITDTNTNGTLLCVERIKRRKCMYKERMRDEAECENGKKEEGKMKWK